MPLNEGEGNSMISRPIVDDDISSTAAIAQTKIVNLVSDLAGRALTSHIHDDRYYTESEIDTKIGNIETLLAAL